MIDAYLMVGVEELSPPWEASSLERGGAVMSVIQKQGDSLAGVFHPPGQRLSDSQCWPTVS